MKAAGTARGLLAAGAVAVAMGLTVDGASAANRTWGGGGDPTNWTTAANWFGTAPAAGDELFFGGTAGLINTNDFPDTTLFGGVTFNSGAGAFSISGNAIDLGGGIVNNSASLQTLNLALALQQDTAIGAAAGGLVLGGVVSGPGFGLTKTGAGTLTLNGAAVHTYTGGTVVRGGTLALDFANLVSATDLINPGSALTLAGGTLSVTGQNAGATSQSFAGLTLNAGHSTIALVQNGGSSTTLGLATIVHNAGGTLNFSVAPSTSGILATTANPAGLLGAWATVGTGTAMTYAKVNGSAQIVAATSGTAASGADLITGVTEPNWITGNNYQLSGSFTLTAARSINLFRATGSAQTFNLGGTLGWDWTLNGILNSGSGVTISRGTAANNLVVGSTLELVLSGGAGTTISAPIVDNAGGASMLTIANTGQTVLSGLNTYSGGTTLSAGTTVVVVDSAGAAGNPTSGSFGAGTAALTLAGGALRAATAADKTIGNAVLVVGDTAFATIAAEKSLIFTGPVTLGGTRTLTVNVGTTVAGKSVTFAGDIGDGGNGYGLVKAGAGPLVLSGANTYGGETMVNAGVLQVGSSGALGTSAGPTTVALGAALVLLNGASVSDEGVNISSIGGIPGNYNGALQAAAGASAVWAGPVTLGSADARIGAGSGGTLTVSGAIRSSGANTNLQVGAGYGGAAGTVVLTAAAGQNSYSGVTSIIRGILKLGAPDTLPVGTVLDVDASSAAEDAIFDLNGFDQTVGGLQRTSVGGGAGGSFIRNTGAGLSTLTVNQSPDSTFAGILQGSLALVKTGAGTLTLATNNAYSGNTTVSAGRLALSGAGAIPGSPVLHIAAGATVDVSAVAGGSYTLGSGQTLRGNGTVAGGLILGGGSVLAPGNSTGTNFFSGALTLSGNTNRFELAGAFDYDQAVVGEGGSLTLMSQPILALDLAGYTSALHDTFTLFDNRFAAAPTLTDTFWLEGGTPLTNRAVFAAGGLQAGHAFRIDYDGGTGNDVTLTVVPEPAAAALFGLAAAVAGLRRRLRGRIRAPQTAAGSPRADMRK